MLTCESLIKLARGGEEVVECLVKPQIGLSAIDVFEALLEGAWTRSLGGEIVRCARMATLQSRPLTLQSRSYGLNK